MKVLDLFSGIGGFSLGLERAGMETVAFCEIEEFPRAVLRKHWPDVPIFEDVRTLKGESIGPVDVICGGYPCQPFSTAGQRRGKEDDRHLWPEFNRLVDELRPTWVIGENVAGHISMGLDDVLSDLEGQGYACRTFVIPACAVSAPHRRDRVWTVAHAPQLHRDVGGEHRQQGQRQIPQSGKPGGEVSLADTPRAERQRDRHAGASKIWEGAVASDGGFDVANSNNTRLQGRKKARDASGIRQGGDKHPQRCVDLPGATWLPEPAVGRVANGVPRRVDRLKSLGNAVVPQIPEMIGRAIMAADNEAA